MAWNNYRNMPKRDAREEPETTQIIRAARCFVRCSEVVSVWGSVAGKWKSRRLWGGKGVWRNCKPRHTQCSLYIQSTGWYDQEDKVAGVMGNPFVDGVLYWAWCRLCCDRSFFFVSLFKAPFLWKEMLNSHPINPPSIANLFIYFHYIYINILFVCIKNKSLLVEQIFLKVHFASVDTNCARYYNNLIVPETIDSSHKVQRSGKLLH